MSGRGVILFGHGSRDPQWRVPMDAVADRIRDSSPSTEVVCAFLEMQAPDLPDALEWMVQRGVDQVVIVPMFLGTGRHARADLPRLVEEARMRHPGLGIEARPSVGENPQLLDLIARIALE